MLKLQVSFQVIGAQPLHVTPTCYTKTKGTAEKLQSDQNTVF